MKSLRFVVLGVALLALLGSVGCARSKAVGAQTGALVEKALTGGAAK